MSAVPRVFTTGGNFMDVIARFEDVNFRRKPLSRPFIGRRESEVSLPRSRMLLFYISRTVFSRDTGYREFQSFSRACEE